MRKALPFILLGIGMISIIIMLGAEHLDRPPASKLYHVAVIASGQSRLVKLEGVRDGLTARGYVLGENLKLSIYDAGSDGESLAELISQALDQSPDLLVTLGGIETWTARARAGSTPVVFVGVADTLAWGLIESIRAPGVGITGVDNGYVELTGKRLEWAKRLMPWAQHMTLLYSPGIIPSESARRAAHAAALQLHLTVDDFAVSQQPLSAQLAEMFAELDTDALVIMPSYRIENALDEILTAAQTVGLPVIGLNVDATREGALISYGASFYDMGFQAARLVDKVLRGIPPENIPVEFPDYPHLSINTGAAEQLKLVLPAPLLSLAHEVIRP